MVAGAIILAAGHSQRLQRDKILLPLFGRPVIAHVLDVFQSCPAIAEIVLMVNEENGPGVAQIAAAYPKVVRICLGGERRQDSVRAGLKAAGPWDWVVVHDGARPCLKAELIVRVLEAAQETGAAIAAVPATDTVKLAGQGNWVETTLPRGKLWLAQTPQVFRLNLLRQAHEQAPGDATDDAALVEALGCRVKLFLASYDNIKITSPEDIALAETILREKHGVPGRSGL